MVPRKILGVIMGVAICFQLNLATAQEDQVFSGPQVDEAMPAFSVLPLFRDAPQSDRELNSDSPDEATLFIFVHQITRPAMGLVRTVTGFAKSLGDRSRCHVVFLSDDVTATQQWAQAARNSLTLPADLFVSKDGPEGPGVLGLNRQVGVTVIIAQQGKVKANHALIQPGDAIDSPQIAASLAKAIGIDPPTADELAKYQSGPMGRRNQPEEVDLRPLLGPVIRLSATAEQVDTAAALVEKEAEKNPAFKKRLVEACQAIVGSGRLDNYGTEHCRKYLKKWSEEIDK